MLIERARALVDRDGSGLAVELGVPEGSPTKAIIRSLTTGLDREPIERKLEVAAYLAQHGTIITFDKRFEAYCRGEKYSLGGSRVQHGAASAAGPAWIDPGAGHAVGPTT